MIRRPPRSTQSRSSAASDVYKRQVLDVSNAFETYQNQLFVLQTQEKNLLTNNRNFQRSEEQFKLGQITSIEFRQAQVNLINAKVNRDTAKFDAKLAEINLLQLSGTLLDVKF